MAYHAVKKNEPLLQLLREPPPLSPEPRLLEDAPLVSLPPRQPVQLLVRAPWVEVHRTLRACLELGQGKVHSASFGNCVGLAVHGLKDRI